MFVLRLALVAILFYGCAVSGRGGSAWFQKYEPIAGDEFRVHSSEITIYNHTGKNISESEWQAALINIGEAYNNLKNCLGFDDSFGQKLKSKINYIIIVPPEKISIPKTEDDVVAFIHVELRKAFIFQRGELQFKIFIRSDEVSEPTIRHELTHAYIALKNNLEGKESDHPHSNPIFCNCVSDFYCLYRK